MLQRERLTQETGPVPIYTSTSPEPEPSSPSAVALYMSSHERHLTKSPSLPHLHKSGAASTAWGTTQGLAAQQRHWQGVQDRAFLLGSTHKPRVEYAPRAIPVPPRSRQPPPQAINPTRIPHPKAAPVHCSDTASTGARVRDALGSLSPQLQVLAVPTEGLGRIGADGLSCTGKGAHLQPRAHSQVNPPSRKRWSKEK